MGIVAGVDTTTELSNLDIDIQNSRQEEFVNSVYMSVDEAIGCELSRLVTEKGVVPSCKAGCYYCCGQHILTSIIEAKAVIQYIKREFSQHQIEDLRIRTRKWHEWDSIRSDSDDTKMLRTYQYCPMLVENECSIYPVRPLICRTHYVCSDSQACRPLNDPKSVSENPVALKSVVTATNKFTVMIKDHIRDRGLHFYDSIMLLPHWIATEMNWHFHHTE
jgi:Fe-S-cluster containining protein